MTRNHIKTQATNAFESTNIKEETSMHNYAKTINLKPEMRMIHASQIRIPTEYQRNLSQSRVMHIFHEFDVNLFSPLEVSLRADGYYYVMDGQHHYSAAMMMNVTYLPCIVHRGLTIADEAAYFRAMNSSRKAPTPLAHFRAALVEGDETTARLQAIFDKLGITLSQNGKGARRISAIGEIQKMVRMYGLDVLERALCIAVYVWYDHPLNCSVEVLGGLCEFVKRYVGKKPLKPYMERLGREDLSALTKKLNGKLIPLNLEGHGTSPFKRDLMCRYLVETYNKGLRSNKLSLEVHYA